MVQVVREGSEALRALGAALNAARTKRTRCMQLEERKHISECDAEYEAAFDAMLESERAQVWPRAADASFSNAYFGTQHIASIAC